MDIKDIENQIINADCMDILKQLPDKCIDLVVTDPPYEMVSGGKGKGDLADRQVNRNILFRNTGLYDGIKNEVLEELYRVMKKTNIFIFCSKNQIHQLLKFFEDKSQNFDILTWHKLNPSPLANMKYLNDTEYCLNFREKNCIIRGDLLQKKKYFITAVNQADKEKYNHPTIKPLDIIKQLVINGSNENDLILDCFSGSGTTAIACHNLKRRFICIEKDYDYWKASVERLENAQAQMKLF
jgi:DNA modification methylase